MSRHVWDSWHLGPGLTSSCWYIWVSWSLSAIQCAKRPRKQDKYRNMIGGNILRCSQQFCRVQVPLLWAELLRWWISPLLQLAARELSWVLERPRNESYVIVRLLPFHSCVNLANSVWRVWELWPNSGEGEVQLMSLGCRYSEAMIRIHHTHRAALNKNPAVIPSHWPWRWVYLCSICGIQFPWITLMITLMITLTYYDSLGTSSLLCLLAEHEAISLLGEVHLPRPRDSKCPTGCSGNVGNCWYLIHFNPLQAALDGLNSLW